MHRFPLAAHMRRPHIRPVRGRTKIWLAALVLLPGAANAARLELGFGLSQPALHKFRQPWAVGGSLSLSFVHPVAPRWSILVGGRYTRYLNDTTSTASVRFLLSNKLAYEGWQLLDIDLGAQYQLVSDRNTIPYLRFLLSNSFWKVWNLEDGSTLLVTDGAGNPADFASHEIFIRGAAGLHYQVHARLGLALEAEVSYLTGIGTAFSDAGSDARSRAEGALFLKATYRWKGLGRAPADYPERSSITRPHVPPDTPLAPGDADGDGVPDAMDRCPFTPPAAANWVDAYGCPMDSDRDGVPDYLDRCGETPPGSPVNVDGCVVDSDQDGVSDLLDRCPDTPPGLVVDAVGCPSYPAFSEKLVFRFNYAPGEAQLDADARAQLLGFVSTLKQNPGVKVAIEGFTDNIGSAEANLVLAQERADRVKAFLVGQGIPSTQLTAIGRGAVDFVGSNDTREGRAQNRRIEITPIR